MAQLIRIRRGTKSELMNYGALQSGELGFCTDTKEVFVGDGLTNNLVGAAMMGTLASRPSAGTKGRYYYVNSGSNTGDMYLDDGTTWLLISSKGQFDAHIADVTIHRKINDTSTSSTELWSSQKVKTEIFNAIKGMDWQDSVKSKSVATPPTTPVTGDRYIVAASATGAWLNKTGQITEWNGTAWVFYPAATGWAAYVEDENKNYTYNNAGQWVPTGGANQNVVAGNGLTGGGSSDTVTIDVVAGNGIELANDAVNVKATNGITSTASGVGVKAYNGINVDTNGVGVKAYNGISVDTNGVGAKAYNGIIVDTNGIAVKAYNGITVDTNGVAVNIDNNSIKYDAANGNKLVVAVIDGGTF